MNGAAYENRLAAVEEALILFMGLSTTPPDQCTPEELKKCADRLMDVSNYIRAGIEMRAKRSAA